MRIIDFVKKHNSNIIIKKDNRVSNNKGFILAELIVVLVVIVLLLAVLLRLVTGYIDDAKRDAELSEARAVRVAIQTMIIDDELDNNIDEMIALVDYENYGLTKKGKERAEELLKIKIGRAELIKINKEDVLTELTYFTINGSKILYKNGEYSVEYIY